MNKIFYRSFILYLLLGSFAGRAGAREPIARGVFNLSQVKPTETVTLEGDWLVFANQLLTPEDVLTLDWSQQKYERIGFQNLFDIKSDQPLLKTYVLKLQGLRKEQHLAVQGSMLLNPTRVTLIAPGQDPYILWEQGQLRDQGEVIPSVVFCCRVGALPRIEGDAYLMVQISVQQVDAHLNFNALLLQPPQFGPAEKLLDNDRWHSYEVFFVIGLYFLLSLNSLSLFLQRRADKASLYLAGFGLGLIIRYAGTEGVFYRIFGSGHAADSLFNLFALYAALGLILYCLLQFINHTFQGFVPRKLHYGISGFTLLSALLPFALTGPQLLLSWMPVSFLQVSIGLYCVWIYIKATLRKEEGAFMGVVGIVLVAVSHIHDFMVATHVYNFPYLGHVGLAGMMFSQALITGKRFASTYEKTKNLSAELAVKNQVLVKQTHEITKLNDDLHEYNLRLEHKVEEKTRDIKSILRSIRQGILLIDRADGTIGDEYSQFLKKMLNSQEVAGHNIMDLCFNDSNMGANDRDQLRNSLSIIIHEDELAFEMNSTCLPLEIIRTVDGQRQILELEWSPVLDGHSTDKLLLVMRDVTELRSLQTEAENQRREMELISQVINIPADKFNGIIRSLERLLDANFQVVFRTEFLPITDVDLLYRNMHTVKGITRSYQLRELTEMIHLAEERYKDGKAGRLHSKEDMLQDIKEIREHLQIIKHLNYDRLGRHHHSEDRFIQIDKRQIEENLQNLSAIDIQNLKADDRGRMEGLKRLFKKIVYTPLHKVIEGQVHSLANLSKTLQKMDPIVDIIDPGVSLNRDSHELLNLVFGHLMRNAMDHGLETADERQKKGKNPQGCIRMEMAVFQETLGILMSDDGRGINLLKVKQSAIEKGLLSEDQEVSAIDVANLILTAGFSTADQVTDISGRGVGLDAVSNYLEEQGGSLELILEDPHSLQLGIVPVKFLITIPSTHFQVVA